MDSIVEEVLRKELKKPEGKLTKAYLEQVTRLILNGTKKVTDAGLRFVNLEDTTVTESGVALLQKALPNCQIRHDFE